MMRQVLWRRRLQFRAGPESTEFHACAHHLLDLMRGNVDLFFSDDRDKLMVCEDDIEDPEFECYFCRGENGP